MQVGINNLIIGKTLGGKKERKKKNSDVVQGSTEISRDAELSD
jgi:hypothetical protein